MRRELALLTTALAIAGAHTTAFAQELAVDPDAGEVRDYDEDRENYSEFWERALSPAAGTYEDLIAQAASLMSTGKDLGDARVLLVDATAARPDAPLAYFWLGVLETRLKNYGACAVALGSAKRVDPSFRAPANDSRLPSAWQLDHDLGLCEALDGRHEDAVAHFSGIINRFESCSRRRGPTCYHADVPWRLGETLMALGRLEEAISTLRSAGTGAAVLYTLAVALDRDEQRTEAKTILDRAISSDSGLRALTSTKRSYIPASDEHYYRGLVRWRRHEFAHARLFFSAYLELAPNSPWRAQASAHLAEARDVPARDALLEVRTYEMSAAARSLESGLAELEKCTVGFPSQLFSVRVGDRLVAASARRPKKTKPSRSVTVQHFDPLRKKRLSTDIFEVTRCLRAVSGKMTLPKLKGAAGTSGFIRFFVSGS